MFKKAYLKKELLLLLISLVFFTAASAMANIPNASQNSADNRVQNSDKTVQTSNTQKDQPKEPLIVIDPGHGGSDVGTYYGDMYEKNVNLDIALRLGKQLDKAGIKIVYTRVKDVDVGLQERADMANSLDADLFISVHNNKMPGNSGYKGTETLYCPSNKPEPGKMDGETLAKIVQNELVKSLKTVDNGIIYRPNLAVLHRTRMPAVIAEIAYISNWSDRSRLDESEFRQKAAEALSGAILKALGKMGAVKGEAGKWIIQ